jgi:hypothetical protein
LKMKFFLRFLFLAVWIWACNPTNEEVTTDPSARLKFSTDSIIFDTVFSEIKNVTKRLRVFNPSKNAVIVSNVLVGGGTNSPYSIIVNGDETNHAKNVEIRGEDSIYVLVTVQVGAGGQNDPFLVEDSILFFTNGNLQQVYLRSWGQDAVYYEDSLLACNITWTPQKPIVIINSVGIDTNCSLTILPGTKVYLDNKSTFFIWGTIKVQGTESEPVTFCGARLEEEFDNQPGQWGNSGFQAGLWLLDPSNSNEIDWAIIKNGVSGIQIGNVYDVNRPDIRISNTIIKNMSLDGIVSYGGNCIAENLLVTNCGRYGIGAFLGGTWDLRHITVATYNFDFSRDDDPSVFVTDWFPDSSGIPGNIEINPMNFNMQNSISWGSIADEFVSSFEDGNSTLGASFNFLKVTESDQKALLEILNNIVSSNTDTLQFIDPREYDYRLDTLSPARDVGNPNIIFLPFDLNGDPRTDGLPDMGAYERQN